MTNPRTGEMRRALANHLVDLQMAGDPAEVPVGWALAWIIEMETMITDNHRAQRHALEDALDALREARRGIQP